LAKRPDYGTANDANRVVAGGVADHRPLCRMRILLRHKIDSCHKVHVAHRWWSPCGAGVGRFEAPLRGGFCAEPFEQLADLGLTKLASKDGARRRSPRPDPAATGPMPAARRNRGSAGARSAPRTVHPAGTRPPIVRAHPNHVRTLNIHWASHICGSAGQDHPYRQLPATLVHM